MQPQPFYDAPLITDAEPRDDHTLLLTFENGERRVFDATPLLEAPVFRPLRDLDAFARVKVVYGSLEWPGERDLAHDMLYHRSVPAPVEAD